MKIILFVAVVQLQSCGPLFAIPWIVANNTFLSFTISQKLLKLMSIESVIVSNHLIISHCLLLLPSISPSTRVFSNESILCIGWPKYWCFSFNISPSNKYSGLISFRIDWLDPLPVQRYYPLFMGKWQPTPVLLPGKSHGQRSLVGCSPWGRKESDTTERRIQFNSIL